MFYNESNRILEAYFFFFFSSCFDKSIDLSKELRIDLLRPETNDLRLDDFISFIGGNKDTLVRYPIPPVVLPVPVDTLNRPRCLNEPSIRDLKPELTRDDIDSFMLLATV